MLNLAAKENQFLLFSRYYPPDEEHCDHQGKEEKTEEESSNDHCSYHY